ncbi:alpha/beta fold hydrolase [Moritella sp. Urea-trap-13]|uniref:alpha/beta fold hydrolase n=1 Tax=Moritella sp. Urea-trap-13 TaxID=2058327 RepID=UPI000C34CB86|nr:alpha/beta hydrolase [Moritella sp. Urea-trap-13]PKH05664.1 alpha/beta hydrolase [Moritella sp. Urea-trap-13]
MISNKLKLFIVCICFSLLSGCSLVKWKIGSDEDSLKAVGFTQQDISLDEGGTLSYWRGGKGQPLLLIHGFGGNAITTWKDEMLALSADYDVIAPDLAWFGDSFSAGEANLTTGTQAIWQLVNQLQLDNINIASISYGGFVTFNMMNNSPHENRQINNAIIIASPGPYFSDDDLGALNTRFAVDNPEDFFVPKNSDELRRLFDGTFVEPKMMPDFVADQIYQTYFAAWHKQKVAMIQSLPADRNALLQAPLSSTPTLLIWGEKDRIFPIEDGIYLSKKIQAPLVIIPNTGHGVTNEQSEIVVRLIKTFIESEKI